MILPNNIVPSLCCIHNGLKEDGVKFNTMTYTQYQKVGKEKGMQIIAERSLNNLVTIRKILLKCAEHGWNYRIGSNVFPLATHPDILYKLEELNNYSEILSECKRIAQIIKDKRIRCSMHPDQFVVPASPNKQTRLNSIRDLEQHGMIMDLFELPRSYEAPINIHMNCYSDGDFESASNSFIESYNMMSESVRSRLVLENEDKPKSWTVQNLHDYIYKKLNIPITFDNLHHSCNPGQLSDKYAMELSVSTWPSNIVPLFHFSESAPGNNPRAHADSPTTLPNIYKEYNKILHLDFEFKLKERAILS